MEYYQHYRMCSAQDVTEERKRPPTDYNELEVCWSVFFVMPLFLALLLPRFIPAFGRAVFRVSFGREERTLALVADLQRVLLICQRHGEQELNVQQQ